jgi:hypothetical protein
VGPFLVNGDFTFDGEVSFSKVYASHRVQYAGFWDGTMISGDWRIEYSEQFVDLGEFEIWPQADESHGMLKSLEIEMGTPAG